tara:strand:+ start:1453 stop:3369 length:1917 start_codon:yes stop_codon:yes gene_type:complete
MVQETVKIQADVKDAVKKISELTKAVEKLGQENAEQQKELTAALSDNAKAGKKQVSVLKKVKGAVGSLGKGFKGLGLVFKGLGFGILIKLAGDLVEKFKENQVVTDALAMVSETLSIVLNQIIDVFKPIIERVKEATGGFDALGKVLGGALTIAVNVIVAAIQGIVLGVQKAQLAWEDSFLGGKDPDKIKQLQADIDATSEKLAKTGENIKNAGKQIGDNFVEALGEVGTLAQGIAEGVSEVVDKVDIKAAAADAKRLVAAKKNFELLALQQQRLIEKYDLQAEQQRQIRDDETLSIAERIEANKELGKILEDQTEAEKASVQARINTIAQEIALKGESVERTNELYELNTELLAVDAKVAGFKSEQLTNTNALLKEQQELTQSQLESETTLSLEQKRFAAEREVLELTKLEKMREVLEAEREIELERLQMNIDVYAEGTQAKVDAQIAYNEAKQGLDQQLATNEDAINREKSKNEIKWAELTTEEKLGVASKSLGQLAGLLGKESAAGKAAAIAAATIDTYQSATSSYKSLAGIPIVGPVLGGIAAAAAVASGIATVKKIAATKTPGPSGGGGGGGSGPTPIPAKAPAFNIVGSGGTNQLAEAIGETEQQPVKAFVVSNDVTSAQSLERNIVESASI